LRAPRLGGARLLALREKFGGIDAMVAAPASELRRAGLKEDSIEAIRHYDAALLDRDKAWLDVDGHHLLTWEDEGYPALLRDIPSPPAALFVAGDADILWQPQLAVIGSRNPTAGGRDNARDFAGELSRQGMTITSGLAAGIDSIAHAAALDAGGYTVAVTGCGLDKVYPASGRRLAQRVQEQGVLVSEFPPGTAPKREHFPTRNRIISGLSLGVLVIEAAMRSGTLITARLAGNQGREVFALPGSIHNPMSKGCHRLIRDGARLVENVEEIMQELASLAGQLAGSLQRSLAGEDVPVSTLELEKGGAKPNLGAGRSDSLAGQDDRPWEHDEEYAKLWSCLGYDPKPVGSLIEQSGLTARAVSAMLLLLELRGLVEAHPGGAYNRIKKR
jgi:DNA processing protein